MGQPVASRQSAAIFLLKGIGWRPINLLLCSFAFNSLFLFYIFGSQFVNFVQKNTYSSYVGSEIYEIFELRNGSNPNLSLSLLNWFQLGNKLLPQRCQFLVHLEPKECKTNFCLRRWFKDFVKLLSFLLMTILGYDDWPAGGMLIIDNVCCPNTARHSRHMAAAASELSTLHIFIFIASIANSIVIIIIVWQGLIGMSGSRLRLNH